MGKPLSLTDRQEIAALAVEVHQLKSEVHELKVDVKTLSRQANMGAGGLKVIVTLGAAITAIWSFFQLFHFKN